MALIKRQTTREGEIFNKWLESRLIKKNQNVLSAELGPTGSGKSYRDLSKVHNWYQYHFKKDYPIENICFGVESVFKRLGSGELKKGEILIFEEAGVNLGSRGWQSKVSQMMNHVLQSFRSMNIAIFMNLPYLSMLDSQARHLLHYYAESSNIDHKKGINKCKPFFVQVAQGSGKIYRHYPKVILNGRTVKVKRFNYNLPPQYLIDAYEHKKQQYLNSLVKGYTEKIKGQEKRDRPSELAFRCYDKYFVSGKQQKEIAKEERISQAHVSRCINETKKWLNTNKNIDMKVDVVPKTHTFPLQIQDNTTHK